MPRVTIPTAAVLPLINMLSLEQSRPVLQCLFIERSGITAATDGRVLGCKRNPVATSDDEDTIDAVRFSDDFTDDSVLARLTPAQWKRLSRGKAEYIVLEFAPFDQDGNDAPCVATAYHFGQPIAAEHGQAVHGSNAPRWRQVFPNTAPHALEAIGFNPELVGCFDEKMWGNVALTFYGPERATLVRPTKDETLVGLIMPVRLVDDASSIPSWVQSSGQKPDSADQATEAVAA